MIKSYPYFTLMIDNWYPIQKIVEDLWTSNQTFTVARTSSNTSVANELTPKQSVSTLRWCSLTGATSWVWPCKTEGPPTTGPKVSFVSKPAILVPGNKAGCQTSSDLIICSPECDNLPIPHHVNTTKKTSIMRSKQSYHVCIVQNDYSSTNH